MRTGTRAAKGTSRASNPEPTHNFVLLWHDTRSFAPLPVSLHAWMGKQVLVSLCKVSCRTPDIHSHPLQAVPSLAVCIDNCSALPLAMLSA